MANSFEQSFRPQEARDAERETPAFEAVSAGLIRAGDRLMEEYGRNERRVYHTIEHPRTLRERAEKVADVFDISEEQKELSRIAISWHDVIIKVDPADPENIAATIKRHRGAREGDQPSGAEGNEAESARAMEAAMRRANEQSGTPVFSEEQIKTAVFAVESTYPAVDLGEKFQGARFKEYPYYANIAAENPKAAEIIDWLRKEGVDKGILFYQPHLETPLEKGEKVPPEVLVMVLDDLGGAGMASREEFCLEGDREFQELYANISNPDNLRRLAEGSEEKDESDREKAAGAMMGWLKSQTSFVAWQMLRIEKIIHLLRENKQLDAPKAEKLRASFNRFEDNIHAMLERSRSTEKTYEETKAREGSRAAFRYLARSMHYKSEAVA